MTGVQTCALPIWAARERLLLLGMPAGSIASAEWRGRPQGVTTISTPVGGVIKTLGVRQGMTVAQGQTLAEVNGLATVWLNAAVPEALAGNLRIGTPVIATLPRQPFLDRWGVDVEHLTGDVEHDAGQDLPSLSAAGTGRTGSRMTRMQDRKSTRLNSSHIPLSRMPSSA